jgi:hypothetical protein
VKKLIILAAMAALPCSVSLARPAAATSSTVSADKEYDLVVYGGTAAGVSAAVSAAREGAKVALLEPTKHIGGMVTGGLSMTDFGNKKCIGGLALEFYERLGKHYSKPIEWYPEPHVAEETLNAMIKEAGVPVFYEHRLLENDGVAKLDDGKITSIKMENGSEFSAKVFADCSYEGDLMAKSGVKYTFGREGQDQYGEELAGVRDKTPYHQFKVDVKATDENGKLLPEIQDGPKGKTGQADKKVQAYNFRLCMTKVKDNQVPFPKPDNYDPARYELLARMIQATIDQQSTMPTVSKLMHPGLIQAKKTDTNNNGAFSTDYIGGSWNYPDATYAERDKIWQEHYDYVAGFMYFLANDPSVPQPIRDEMNTWGLAKDEFQDTNNWPRQLYVREGRRMVGDFVMTQADIQTSRTKDDSIGMGSYNSDSHNVQRFMNADGFAENEGDMQVRVKPYEIPYRIMLPKKEQVKNLLVPVTLSASHVTYSTVRMEPQYMILGQAAGVAAAMASKTGTGVHDVDTSALGKRLGELKAVLELPEYQ